MVMKQPILYDECGCFARKNYEMGEKAKSNRVFLPLSSV
jgi:hypothetical protein